MDHQISIREMLPDEEREVRLLYKRSLGLIDRIAFTLAFRETLKSARRQKGSCLVALHEGRVVGSFSLRIISIAGQSIGLIDAIVTDQDFRGKGIGKYLMEEALSWFKKRECETICATADRYNSPSWNMFIHKGFSIYDFPRQFRDLGWNFIRLWFAEGHIIGFGTFFLRKTSRGERQIAVGQTWHFVVAWLVLALLWWIPTVRGGSSLVMIPLILTVVGLGLFAHEIAHKLIASFLGLKTTFRVWESGLLFSSLLALFGAFFPAYGSTYIEQVDWRYDAKRKETGWIFVAGPTLSMALAISFWVVMSFANNELLVSTARVGYITNIIFVILNLLPIQAAGGPSAWDGRKIFTWNKIVWSLLTIGVASLIVIDVLF